MNRWLSIAAAVAVIALLAFGAYSWQRGHRSEVHVQTAVVTSGPIVRRLVVSGTLQSVKTVDVGSQVSGLIKSLEVDFNSIVRQGQVIAHVDPATFEAAVADAQAMYEKSQADLGVAKAAQEDADTKHTRAKELAATELIMQSDLDAARILAESAAADVGSAQAQVTRAKATLDQAQTNLAHTVITSPVDGIIVNRAVDVGQTVAASFQTPVLFSIAASLDEMQVQAQVDEADVGAVKEGQDVTFQVESYPDDTFQGVISQVRIQPTASGGGGGGAGGGTGTNALTGASFTTAANGVTYSTIIDVKNADHRLRPGMTATAVLTGSSRENATRIPNTALLFRPSIDLLKAVGESGVSTARNASAPEDAEEMERVWTYDGSHFTPVAVALGLSDAQWVEETRGPLKPGDTVVMNATYGPEPKAPAQPPSSPFTPGRGGPPGRGR